MADLGCFFEKKGLGPLGVNTNGKKWCTVQEGNSVVS
jgi:hypothetical protein